MSAAMNRRPGAMVAQIRFARACERHGGFWLDLSPVLCEHLIGTTYRLTTRLGGGSLGIDLRGTTTRLRSSTFDACSLSLVGKHMS